MDRGERQKEIREYLEKLGTTHRKIIETDKLSKKYNVAKSVISRDITKIEETLQIDEKEFGVITQINDVVDGEDVEIIWIKYENEDVLENTKPDYHAVKYFPNRQITTICKEFKDETTGKLDYHVIKEGMNQKEIIKFFPPYRKNLCHFTELILSIMYEAYRKEKEYLEPGNVRNFWYTHIQYTINESLGIDETDSIKTLITLAWKMLVKSGMITYEEMKIIGGKEAGRLSAIENSPFSNIIIGLEKMTFFLMYKWIPELFNCTLICAGGEPSRSVIDAFVRDLKKNGVDLNQKFYLCIASDLDPDGFYIQHAFKEQLETAIKLNGGTGKVEIRRLFVRKDQVTDTLLKTKVVSWRIKKSSKLSKDTLKKIRDTRWSTFCKLTKTEDDPGGLYKPVPPGFTEELEGDILKHPLTGEPVVRAKLEMNMFSTKTIEDSILDELQNIIKESSDETKIMIPEIMRIFDEIRDGQVVKKLFKTWSKDLIDPEKEKFSKDIDKWSREIYEEKDKKDEITNKKYNELIEEKEDEKREREPELLDEKDDLKEIIETLNNERIKKMQEIIEDYIPQRQSQETLLNVVNEEITEKCGDLEDDISDLEDEQTEELQKIEEERDLKIKTWEKFKEEHLAIFNPVEQELEEEIRKKLDEINWRFRDLEKFIDAKNEICRLLVNQKLLLDDGISCFDQPSPTFLEKNLLKKAADDHDENIGKVRKSFSYDLKYSMYNYAMKRTKDFTFTLSKTVDAQDLSEDIRKAKEEIEEKIKEKEDV